MKICKMFLKKNTKNSAVTILFAAILLCFIFTSCKDNGITPPDPPEPPEPPVEYPVKVPFTDCSLGKNCDRVVFNYGNLTIINSNEELEEHIHCEETEIDFSTKTLLVLFSGSPNPIVSFSKELLLLEDNTYSLNIEIQLTPWASPQGWRVIIITDKINSSSSVNVNVKERLFGSEE